MIGVLYCHRDRDARAGGGDQVGSYLGSVGFGSACDLLLELGMTDRKDASDSGRYLRVCKSRLAGLRRGDTTHLSFEDGRYVRRTAGAALLSDRDRECAQIAADTREFRARKSGSEQGAGHAVHRRDARRDGEVPRVRCGMVSTECSERGTVKRS